jgi:hypothetical protein
MVRSARRKRVEEAVGRIEEKSGIEIKTIASGEEEVFGVFEFLARRLAGAR